MKIILTEDECVEIIGAHIRQKLSLGDGAVEVGFVVIDAGDNAIPDTCVNAEVNI